MKSYIPSDGEIQTSLMLPQRKGMYYIYKERDIRMEAGLRVLQRVSLAMMVQI